MTAEKLPASVATLVAFLGELGPRWGLPEVACRLHGYLYLQDRPVSEQELDEKLGLAPPQREEALAWLSDYGLLRAFPPDAWGTDSDPWNLVLKALEERRRREIGPAIELLRDCQQTADSEGPDGRRTSRQIAKLLSLAEDIEAIEMQARRLSPGSLRRFLRVGGQAARLLDRGLGRRN